jgi:NitT/TauT family transport system ATP-binding protein
MTLEQRDGRPQANAIEAKHLRMSFQTQRGEVVALSSIDLAVADQEFVALLGPSGCGKSTLLFLVAGLHLPTGGELWCYGRRVDKPGRDRTVMFQDYALFPWRTVLGNVSIALEGRPEFGDPAADSRRALRSVGLAEFEHAYPHQLSGGMKQRTALARCLAMRPRVLLMDEPFAAVDAQTRESLQAELLQLWTRERMTVLFVTHSLEEAIYLAQRVVVMKSRPGRIKGTVAIDEPYPREYRFRTSRLMNELRSHIYQLLHEEERGVSSVEATQPGGCGPDPAVGVYEGEGG